MRSNLSTPSAHTLPLALRMFLFTSFTASSIALICEFVAARFLHLPWPYRFPLFSDGTGGDLHAFDAQLPYIHSARFFDPRWPAAFSYPAPLAPVYSLFALFPHRVTIFNILVCVLAMTAVARFAWLLHSRTHLRRSSTAWLSAGALLLSYPLAFELRQGNVEIVVVALVASGVLAFIRKRYHLSGALLGLAVAMKIFPFVYLGLLLARRRWAALGTALLTCAAATASAMYYVCPDLRLAAGGISAGLGNFQRFVTLKVLPQTAYDHSLFGLFKVVLNGFANDLWERHALTFLHVYLLLAATAGLVFYFGFIRKLPLINQVFCLSVASILLPPVSFDYTLQHLYLPGALLAFYTVRNAAQPPHGLVPMWVCLGLLTSIQTEFIYHGYSLAGQIKAITLIVLFVLAARCPFPTVHEDTASGTLPRKRSLPARHVGGSSHP